MLNFPAHILLVIGICLLCPLDGYASWQMRFFCEGLGKTGDITTEVHASGTVSFSVSGSSVQASGATMQVLTKVTAPKFVDVYQGKGAFTFSGEQVPNTDKLFFGFTGGPIQISNGKKSRDFDPRFCTGGRAAIDLQDGSSTQFKHDIGGAMKASSNFSLGGGGNQPVVFKEDDKSACKWRMNVSWKQNHVYSSPGVQGKGEDTLSAEAPLTLYEKSKVVRGEGKLVYKYSAQFSAPVASSTSMDCQGKLIVVGTINDGKISFIPRAVIDKCNTPGVNSGFGSGTEFFNTKAFIELPLKDGHKFVQPIHVSVPGAVTNGEINWQLAGQDHFRVMLADIDIMQNTHAAKARVATGLQPYVKEAGKELELITARGDYEKHRQYNETDVVMFFMKNPEMAAEDGIALRRVVLGNGDGTVYVSAHEELRFGRVLDDHQGLSSLDYASRIEHIFDSDDVRLAQFIGNTTIHELSHMCGVGHSKNSSDYTFDGKIPRRYRTKQGIRKFYSQNAAFIDEKDKLVDAIRRCKCQKSGGFQVQ